MAETSLLEKRVQLPLLLLRVGVGIVMLMWTIDKLLNPGHAAVVFEKYYQIPGLQTGAAYAIGAVQLIIVLAFLSGTFKTYSYMIILLMHTVSTLSTYKQMMPIHGRRETCCSTLPSQCWPLAMHCGRCDEKTGC